ncbi:MAG: antirestriction protein ArdA, partial [Peptostreptococcaceae bacterium]
VKLPISDKDLGIVLDAISINETNEEYFISDYETCLNIEISEYESISQLNIIANEIKNLSEYEIEALNLLLNDGGIDMDDIIKFGIDNIMGNCSIIELDGDTDKYEDLAYNYIEQICDMENIENIDDYFDYEKYGRDLRLGGDLGMYLEDYAENEAEEFMQENDTDEKIGEYFADINEIDENMAERYFNYEEFGRYLSHDFTIGDNIAIYYC